MTDYQPLIARAVDGLGTTTGEARRALYERARSALVTQLRSVDPPLSESDITRERLSLEEAIRKVEANAARKARMEGRSTPRFEPRPLRPHSLPDTGETLAELAQRLEAFGRPEKPLDTRATLAEMAKRLESALSLAEKREEIAEPKRIRARLAEIASPSTTVTSDGRLDAGPNSPYDIPTIDDDLVTLPIRQQAVLSTVISGLPRNAPKQLVSALKNYLDEIKGRGTQPILGLLKDMAAIIEAEVGAPSARAEWLPEGLQAAFERFSENHALFMEHFTLDIERERIFDGTDVDETKLTGSEMVKPFEALARAASSANKAGMTTDDFKLSIDKMTEFAWFISTLPNIEQKNRNASGRDKSNPKGRLSTELAISPADITEHSAPPVTARKRFLLSALGFSERTIALSSGITTLATTPTGQQLIDTLKTILDTLSTYLKSR